LPANDPATKKCWEAFIFIRSLSDRVTIFVLMPKLIGFACRLTLSGIITFLGGCDKADTNYKRELEARALLDDQILNERGYQLIDDTFYILTKTPLEEGQDIFLASAVSESEWPRKLVTYLRTQCPQKMTPMYLLEGINLSGVHQALTLQRDGFLVALWAIPRRQIDATVDWICHD